MLAVLSGQSWQNVQGVDMNFCEIGLLISTILMEQPGLFSYVEQFGRRVFERMLSVSQVVELKALLRLPMATFRRMRTLFSAYGFKIFPSEPKKRQETSARLEHLKDAQMESVDMFLQDNSVNNPLKSIPFLMSKNLEGYIGAVLGRIKAGGNAFYSKADSVVRVAIGGDKGGDAMKFHFQVCHPETSVFDVHIFCMYGSADSSANMCRVLASFQNQFMKMSKPDFRLCGHQVQFFLSGDFKFLDCVLGHMGSSATFPSVKDYVSKDHLKGHGGMPHTPVHCNLTLRSVLEMEDHYNANLSDDRSGHNQDLNLNKTGRLHASIARRNLFSFLPLDHVVPPVLHITLGIVLRLFNILISKCRSLDGMKLDCVTKVVKNWEKKSKILNKKKEEEVRGLGRSFLDLRNFQEHLCALSEDNMGTPEDRVRRSEFAVKK